MHFHEIEQRLVLNVGEPRFAFRNSAAADVETCDSELRSESCARNCFSMRTGTNPSVRSEHSQGGAQQREQYLYGAQRAMKSAFGSFSFNTAEWPELKRRAAAGANVKRA